MKILIHIEGGIVQSVSCNDPSFEADVFVIDYDTEGIEPATEENDVYLVPQSDNPTDLVDAVITRFGEIETTWPKLSARLDEIEIG